MIRSQRKFDRDLLPSPVVYYNGEFPNIKIKSRYVNVNCCFHPDNNPSLSLNMIDGYFKCHSCGVKGKDVLAFQRQRYGMTFMEAVDFFGAWRQGNEERRITKAC